ncbi:MAG TPA: integrin alpha [Planctomycetota bacterium]|nr:integrin alpha [Planctomycetota bacterium]
MKTQVAPLAFLAILGLTSAASAQAPLYDIPGVANSSLGWGLGSVGDVDGDGRDDILVGAPTADGLEANSGQAMILSSVNAWPIRTFQGEFTGDRFGTSVAGIGDLTGDGISEVAVGAPEHDRQLTQDAGAVYIFNGATGAEIMKYAGSFTSDKFGWCVSPAGDANGDGTPDFAYGAPYADSNSLGVNVGLVKIISGASLLPLQTYWGETAGDYFGYSICAIGDLTGDGKSDMIAGAPNYNLGGVSNAGRVYRLSGGTNSRVNMLSGGVTNGNVGFSVSALPDVNLDGVTEIAVGEPGWNGLGANTGRVRALSGLGGSIVQTYSYLAGVGFGFSVAGLHDIDGDGRGDLIVGLPYLDSAPLFDVGSAFIISGQLGTVLGSASGYGGSDYMGFAVANAGDLNNDGIDDMLMSAPVSTAPFTNGGWVRAHLGGAPTPTGYCTAKVNSLGCTPTISYGGCASRSLGSGIAIVGQNVRPGLPGILLWSVAQNALPFSGGTLCVGAPIKRTPGQISTSIPSSSCTGQYYYLFSTAYLAANNLNPGQAVHTQYWSRDNGFSAPNNVGLTAGLKFTVVP